MVNSRKSENVSCAVSILYLAQQDHRHFAKKGKRENGGKDGRREKGGKKREGERRKKDEG